MACYNEVESMNILLNKKFQITLNILLILFALFIIYQIIRKIFGGSWDNEDIIVSLLMMNFGCLFTVALLMMQFHSDFNHYKDQFKSLANDFKEHTKKSI